MRVQELAIPAIKVLTPARLRGGRGFLSEVYNRRTLARAGIDTDFVQDNHSVSSRRGTVRGLHFQIPPHAQHKLVRVVRGAVFDVAVDLRRSSPTYGRHASAVLSADAWNQVLVPAGFAHGFMTLEPDSESSTRPATTMRPTTTEGSCGTTRFSTSRGRLRRTKRYSPTRIGHCPGSRGS